LLCVSRPPALPTRAGMKRCFFNLLLQYCRQLANLPNHASACANLPFFSQPNFSFELFNLHSAQKVVSF
jgi:hypothetical protein